MGYLSRVSGEIVIEPPVSYAELKHSALQDYLGDQAWRNGKCVKIEVVTEEIDTPDGVLHRSTGRAIAPASYDQMKAYDIEAEVKELVRLLAGHGFGGHLRIEGEDTGDIWRIVVKSNDLRDVIVEQASVIWPDGTTEPPCFNR